MAEMVDNESTGCGMMGVGFADRLLQLLEEFPRHPILLQLGMAAVSGGALLCLYCGLFCVSVRLCDRLVNLPLDRYAGPRCCGVAVATLMCSGAVRS